MRMPGFSAEASLNRLSDSHYMAMQSATQAERDSVVSQQSSFKLPPQRIGGCHQYPNFTECWICDDDGCDPLILPNKRVY